MTADMQRASVTLPTDKQILITRHFDAPRALLYEAWTTPALVERWWHANRGEVVLVEIDLKVGGRWRQVMVAKGGIEVAFHGEYLEIVSGERIVSTDVYEAMPGEGALNTLTLEDADGGTLLTLLVEHKTSQARDFHVNSGMEDGLQDALDLLEQTALTLG